MPKSQFFRVATVGATTDGSNIDRATIEQIAATYNPKTYGARIWLEQAQRIKAQQGPDGTAYPARKRRKEFKGKNGRIKRQKGAMFAKIRTAKHLKVKATGNQIEVGFFGWVARVAHVHQFGQQDRVTKKGAAYKYPERPLLGLSDPDWTLIRESMLRRIGEN